MRSTRGPEGGMGIGMAGQIILRMWKGQSVETLQRMLSSGHLGLRGSGLRTIVTRLLPIHMPCTILDALVTNLPPPPTLLELCSLKCTGRWGRSVDGQNKIFLEFWPW